MNVLTSWFVGACCFYEEMVGFVELVVICEEICFSVYFSDLLLICKDICLSDLLLGCEELCVSDLLQGCEELCVSDLLLAC